MIAWNWSDTVVAPLNAAGTGAVTLVRISGPATRQVMAGLCPVWKGGGQSFPKVRQAVLCRIMDGVQVLDQGMCTWFEGPASYTGEDMAEFGLHASPFVVNRFLALS